MKKILQLVAGYRSGDAISGQADILTRVFRSWGYEVVVGCDHRNTAPERRGATVDLRFVPDTLKPDDLAVLHLSMGHPVNDLFAGLTCKKVIIYHNITPPRFFKGINQRTANDLSRGIEQVHRLAGAADINIAVSRFNASELTAARYHDVRVLPLFIDTAAPRGPSDPSMLSRLQDGRRNILFVGRCVPNKRIEDILATFRFFQQHLEPDARLVLAGSPTGAEAYEVMLRHQARALPAGRVFFAGALSLPELNACYASADVFLCMSEHEGFCMPLIEAMVHRVPIMAFAAAAVPETLDGSGILFDRKDETAIAEMMLRVVKDREFRNAILLGQDQRLARLTDRHLDAELRELLAPIL
jgi:glycosyltransferase involved in cell wall biosynthesis